LIFSSDLIGRLVFQPVEPNFILLVSTSCQSNAFLDSDGTFAFFLESDWSFAFSAS